MSDSLVSVVIPVYNTERWLRRCLDGVCGQTYQNLEILCVDDGSQDNSLSILNEYAGRDSRLRIVQQRNMGVSAARNTATEMSRGEWVCYVDSDDYMEDSILEKAVSMVTPEVDVVSFGVECVWEPEQQIPDGMSRYYTLHANIVVLPAQPELAGELNHAVWGKLWRRSVIVEHGVHSPLGMRYEDEAFFYLFLHHARNVAFCSDVGYYYRQRSSSFIHTKKSAVEIMQMTLRVMRYAMENVKVEGHNPAECPWCQDMLSRIYEARYHVTPESERPECTRLAGALAMEKGFLPRLTGDYRFRCLQPVLGWRRLFLSRYLNAEIYRMFGIPVWLVEFRNGIAVRHSCMLGGAILRKLGLRRTVSGSH